MKLFGGKKGGMHRMNAVHGMEDHAVENAEAEQTEVLDAAEIAAETPVAEMIPEIEMVSEIAEAEAEAALLAHNRTLHADLYKASHHGSSTSSTKALLDVMQPKMAAVSCGAGNDYGHPHWEVLQRFETAGIRYRRTDVNGSLLFTAKDGVLTAYCEKRG